MQQAFTSRLTRTDRILAFVLMAGGLATVLACGSGPERPTPQVFGGYPRSEAFDAVVRTHMDAADDGENRLLMATWFQDGDPRVARFCTVRPSGECSNYQYVRDWGLQGFAKSQLPPQTMDLVKQAIDELPPTQKPRMENMLIVSFRQNGAWQTRLYDRLSRPPSVSTLYGLTGAPIVP